MDWKDTLKCLTISFISGAAFMTIVIIILKLLNIDY